jgi:hypothetical protein
LNKLTKGDNEEDGLKAENQTQDLWSAYYIAIFLCCICSHDSQRNLNHCALTKLSLLIII